MPIEIQEVLSSGWHNAEQDEWKDEHGSWAYAIEGETLDGRELRVPVSFVEADDVLVVTVVDIDRIDR